MILSSFVTWKITPILNPEYLFCVIGRCLAQHILFFIIYNIFVQNKQIKDWNYVFLSHSYEDLCSCFHKYLLTYFFLRVTICYNHPSYYGFYTFTNYVKTFEDQYFNYPSQVYYMKLSTFYNKLFSSSEGVSKGLKHSLTYKEKLHSYHIIYIKLHTYLKDEMFNIEGNPFF
jgi:hypothetical protein